MTEMVLSRGTAGAMSVALLSAGSPRFVVDLARLRSYLWYGDNECPPIDRSGTAIHRRTTTFHQIAVSKGVPNRYTRLART